MTYRFDKGRRGERNRATIALSVFFCCVVFFWPTLKPFFYRVTEPVTKRAFEVVGGVSFVPEFVRVYFSSRRALVEDKRALMAHVEELENQLAKQELTLRELRGIVDENASSSLPHQVPIVASSLAQDVTKIYSTVIFSKGYGDGVALGDNVYLRKRQIVCQIKEVYARTSLCDLYSGYGQKVEGVTASSSINITLEGRGGHYIANVVRDTPVAVGEKILLRGDQSFVLGEVVQLFNNDQDTSWRILVRGEYNPVHSSLYYIEKK